MKIFSLTFLLFITALFPFSQAYGLDPKEELNEPHLEERARHLSQNIRCVVCQSQSIDESDADLAKDLRKLLREKIRDGQSDKEILEFLTQRYGDFILLSPAIKEETYFLWFSPLVFLLLGALCFIYFIRPQKK